MNPAAHGAVRAPVGEAEVRRTVVLALLLSAGLHMIMLLTLDGVPGAWRPGLAPALRVSLLGEASAVLAQRATPAATSSARDEPPLDAAPPHVAARPGTGGPSMAPGRPADRSQSGSSMPIQEQYFRKGQLDLAAVVVERPALIYPEHAYITRMAGTIRARIFISETGVVDLVRIEYADPPGIFEFAAVAALRGTRYRPALIAGQPVKSQKLIEVKFDPHEGAPDASSRVTR